MKILTILFCFSLLTFGVALNAGATQISYVGGHLTFTFWENGNDAMWGEDIDVVNVWEVTMTEDSKGPKVEFRSVFTSLDVGPDYDNIPGAPMVDGPFQGFSASFDFALTQNKKGSWAGEGVLTMFDPLGNIVNPDPNEPTIGADQVTSGWNGQFGDTGEYTLTQRRSNYFQHWEVTSIDTFEVAGLYTIPTNDYLYETEIVTTSQGDMKRYWKNDRQYGDADTRVMVMDESSEAIPTSDINFYVPNASVAVPEPSSVLLLASGLAGVAVLRGRRNR